MKKKIVFTFGTLFDPQVIKALLGEEPENFLASLEGFSIYKGKEKHLPKKVKKYLAPKYDLKNFSFLFVKPDNTENYCIQGKAYIINPKQEKILDIWEQYPNWYDKMNIIIKDSKGKEYNAYVYTVKHDGEELKNYKRIVNNFEEVIKNARLVNQSIK